MPSLTCQIVPEVPVYPERLQSKPPRKWGRNEIFDPKKKNLSTPKSLKPSSPRYRHVAHQTIKLFGCLPISSLHKGHRRLREINHSFTHTLWKQCPHGSEAVSATSISSWQMEHTSPQWASDIERFCSTRICRRYVFLDARNSANWFGDKSNLTRISKLRDHCCRLRDAIHFHHWKANLNLLAGILIVPARNKCAGNVNNDKSFNFRIWTQCQTNVLRVFTMKFCFKDVVTSDTLPRSPQKVQQTQANHFRVRNVGSLLNQSGSGLGKIEIIQNKVHTQFTITAIIWKNMNDSHRFTAHEFDALK